MPVVNNLPHVVLCSPQAEILTRSMVVGLFGQLVKNRRAHLELGLREFCEELGYDPSNWSKIERALFPPPSDRKLLERVATVLGMDNDPQQCQELYDAADLDRNQIPKDISEDAHIMSMLPAFMRTIRETKPTSEEIDELMKLLREDFREKI